MTAREQGNVTSPNFPSAYPNDISCQWTFVADEGYRVQLQFHAFDVERCGSCGCDSVQVHVHVHVHVHVYTYTYTQYAYTCPCIGNM